MPTLLEKLRLSELSLVDRGANQHAKVTILKRANTNAAKIAKSYYSAVSEGSPNSAKSFKEILASNEKRKKLWEVRDELYPLLDAFTSSVSAITTDTGLNDSGRRSRIEQTTEEFLSAVREKMPEIEDELTKSLSSYLASSASDSTANNEDINSMADAPTVETLTSERDVLKAELAKAEVLAKMSDKAKAYMAKLDDKGKEAFLSLSTEDQEKKVASVTKNDETVELDGQTIRKSEVGDGAFTVLKAQAERVAKMEERLAKAEDDAHMERLAKRADDDMGNLPGDRVFKARVLKAADTLSDEDKAAFTALVKAANDALAGAFEEKGVKKGKEVAANPAAAFEEAAKEVAKRDNVTLTKAYEIVGREQPELYAAIETPRG